MILYIPKDHPVYERFPDFTMETRIPCSCCGGTKKLQVTTNIGSIYEVPCSCKNSQSTYNLNYPYLLREIFIDEVKEEDLILKNYGPSPTSRWYSGKGLVPVELDRVCVVRKNDLYEVRLANCKNPLPPVTGNTP
jgi:hypothetical protein